MRVRCLSIHADYACRHSGECCRAGWPIPLDADLQQQLEARTRVPLQPVLETSPCLFLDKDTQLCAIHTQFGAEFKPPSCRHFPRVALLDARGVSLTLSHYCPTAASMLLSGAVPLGIVEDPPSFPSDDEYEGLDARHVMPPLLRPGMLWDLDGYSAWETEAVSLLAEVGTTPESALAALEGVALEIERWSPSMGLLAEHVRRAFRARLDTSSPRSPSAWGDAAPVVNRYLAARLFASWVPYRSNRLSALVLDLAHAHTVLSAHAARTDLLAAIRATDLQLVHITEAVPLSRRLTCRVTNGRRC